MGAVQPWHILLVLVVAMVLFGYKKLPDAARSVGRSMRIFKSEVSGLREDNAQAREAARPAPPATPPVIEGEPVIRPTSTTEEPSRRRKE